MVSASSTTGPSASTAPLRFALIGYGAWGRHHALALAKTPGAELAALCTASEASRAQARADFSELPLYADWREMIAQEQLDAVDLVLPNHLHANAAVDALEAGLDVLVEKPLATTLEDCDRMIAAAERYGRVLSVGHLFRQSTQWGAVQQAIAAGEIGEPAFLNVSLFRNFYRAGDGDWRHDAAQVGSWVLEEAVHFFDFALWFFAAKGAPVALHALANSKGRAPALYDNFTCTVRWADGAYALVNQCIAGFENHLVVEVAGSEGAIRSTWSGVHDRTDQPAYELKVQPRGFPFERGVKEAEVRPLAPSGEVFELETLLAEMVGAFRERRPLLSGAEARERVRLCLEAERSIWEGREVRL